MSKNSWYPLAIELAKTGLSQKEVYERICYHCAKYENLEPTYPAVCSYLYRNKDLWQQEAMMKKNPTPVYSADERFANLKKFTIQAAKELFYDKSYISRLEHAKTESELTRIMVTARERSYED